MKCIWPPEQRQKIVGKQNCLILYIFPLFSEARYVIGMYTQISRLIKKDHITMKLKKKYVVIVPLTVFLCWKHHNTSLFYLSVHNVLLTQSQIVHRKMLSLFLIKLRHVWYKKNVVSENVTFKSRLILEKYTQCQASSTNLEKINSIHYTIKYS